MNKPEGIEIITTYNYHKFIEPRICEEMGIEKKYFRNYHKLPEVGGSYKDCWHVWLEIIDEEVRNDSVTTLRFTYDEVEDWFIEMGKEKYGDWTEKFIRAALKVIDEHGIEYIKYSW